MGEDRARRVLVAAGIRPVARDAGEGFPVGDTEVAIEALSAAVEDGRPFRVTYLSTIWERLGSNVPSDFSRPCQVRAAIDGHAGVEILLPGAGNDAQ